MRYSIFQYSQEKLLEYSLDVTDALILNWFTDFFSGSMEKKIFEGKVFGWVKLSKVLEDLPCIGINSEKGIKRRFDNFVEQGILDRISVPTQKGKKTFYKPTPIYESLTNTEQNRQKEEKISQGYFDSHAKKSEPKKDAENPQGTKTTYAKNCGQKNDQKISQGYFDSHAKGNSSSHAQGYFDSHALNDSLTTDSITKNTAANNTTLNTREKPSSTSLKKSEEEVLIIQKIKSLFGGNYNFYGNLEKSILELTRELSCEDRNKFIDYAYDNTLSKRPNKFSSMFFKLVTSETLLQDFLIKKSDKDDRHVTVEEKAIEYCPCCGMKLASKMPWCVNCLLPRAEMNDSEKVRTWMSDIVIPRGIKCAERA